jgi:hypothetical protein
VIIVHWYFYAIWDIKIAVSVDDLSLFEETVDSSGLTKIVNKKKSSYIICDFEKKANCKGKKKNNQLFFILILHRTFLGPRYM